MPTLEYFLQCVNPYNDHNDNNYKRDYIDKRQQYQQLGIPEYWIIDPTKQLVTVLLLADGTYRGTEFRDNQQIVSRTFPEMKVTGKQVLSAT
ncbi:MAG: Uma2 family endonuclease [Merismopedia sp. SIO2A8]|nr:Uma2 family endonuclease [Symploca sp. SIO2B6]NET49566.1 Uma2 family endonuclease [Merismopedia sp. SIO2A8]